MRLLLVLLLLWAGPAWAGITNAVDPPFTDSDTLCCVKPGECYRAAACPATTPVLTHGPRTAARAPSADPVTCDLNELRRAAIQWAHTPPLPMFVGPASSEQYRHAAMEMDVREQADARLRKAVEACK